MSSATATPVAPTPTEIQSLARSSAVNCPARPSSMAQRRSPVSSMRSRITPSAPTRRPAWVTTSWRISVGSRRTVIRAAISRSACSASARRARAALDRSSSSNSRAVRIVMAAWSAIASRTWLSLSPHASRRLVKIVRLPNGPLSPVRGAAMTERTPDAAT